MARLQALVDKTAVLLDPVQIGGDAGEHSWPADLATQSNTERGGTNQSVAAIGQHKWATRVTVAGGGTAGGLDADVGLPHDAAEPGRAARVGHDGHGDVLQFVSDSGVS